MKIRELYNKLSEYFPTELSCSWDNDGLMCCTDSEREVKKVLCALDVTESIVDYAIENGFDLIISHHPLIFHPLKSVNEKATPAKKVIKLIQNEISVFSFHTRADKVEGGVNDRLAELVGLKNVEPFGEDALGRIGDLDDTYNLEDFAYRVKMAINSDVIKYSDAFNPVRRVALIGGDGKSGVREAIAEGADTYISGRIGYNAMEEAAEMGINLIEAGHYFTEQPVTEFFRELLLGFDPDMYVEIASSNMIKYI